MSPNLAARFAPNFTPQLSAQLHPNMAAQLGQVSLPNLPPNLAQLAQMAPTLSSQLTPNLQAQLNLGPNPGVVPQQVNPSSSLDEMFSRKRGRPPKNRVVEVWTDNINVSSSCLINAPVKICFIFYFFEFEENFHLEYYKVHTMFINIVPILLLKLLYCCKFALLLSTSQQCKMLRIIQ